MQPLRYSINITVDGCCDHRAVKPTLAMHEHAATTIGRADSLLFGRVIFQMMEQAWRIEPSTPPNVRDDVFARQIDGMKKYVVSSTLKRVDWNAELLEGELTDAVTGLKEQPGRGIYVGGVTLPLALAERGLIDEYEFVVHPVLAGHGPRPFADLSTSVDLQLVGNDDLGDGVTALRYVPAS